MYDVVVLKLLISLVVVNDDSLSQQIRMSQEQGRREGGGQGGGAKYLGPGLVWGPEILIKHLFIVLLSRGLGARNAKSLPCPGARPRLTPALLKSTVNNTLLT